MIYISSAGDGGSVQRNVMGIYVKEPTVKDGWPTWKMTCRDDRYVFKCPCTPKRNWLVGVLFQYWH